MLGRSGLLLIVCPSLTTHHLGATQWAVLRYRLLYFAMPNLHCMLARASVDRRTINDELIVTEGIYRQ